MSASERAMTQYEDSKRIQRIKQLPVRLTPDEFQVAVIQIIFEGPQSVKQTVQWPVNVDPRDSFDFPVECDPGFNS